MADESLNLLVEAVTSQAPSGAELIGAAVSPEGRVRRGGHYLPSAAYLMDDLFECVDGRWQLHSGGSAGVSWTSLADDGTSGVMRYVDEAPTAATAVVVMYEGTEYRVPVRHGHFLAVVWNTRYTEEPHIARFE